jgi:hypothetical protein
MREVEKMQHLKQLGTLVCDARMMALERAARARQSSLDRLAELDRPATPTDLPPVVAGEVAMRYALWSDQRRTEINLVLARQTAEWVEARREASLAFGRDQVLGTLALRRK